MSAWFQPIPGREEKETSVDRQVRQPVIAVPRKLLSLRAAGELENHGRTPPLHRYYPRKEEFGYLLWVLQAVGRTCPVCYVGGKMDPSAHGKPIPSPGKRSWQAEVR